ncbi:hypothetical protein J4456_00055 [Candidatus Pacearchaeota archaeon]|nr:hypothetical protein [Candidatus Pacearchaeota archaeon]
MTTYGFISDIHEDPRIINPLLEALVQKGVEKLIVNGDIGGNYGSLENSQAYTAFILNEIGKTGLECYVQPGSHETLLGYSPVIEHFSQKFRNIIDVIKSPKVEQKEHTLVFLPGSDFTCGGEYFIGKDEKISTGNFVRSEAGILSLFRDWNQYNICMKYGGVSAFHFSNMNDLRSLVTEPEKTIAICHVPRKFDTVERGVDVAHFYESREYSKGKEEYQSKGVFPAVAFNSALAQRDNTPIYRSNTAENDIEAAVKTEMWTRGLDILKILVEQKTNRGNKDLKQLYEQLGITKAVSGHFHESSHRTHDSKGNYIPEKTPTKELFWNSGHGDKGLAGLLFVDGEEVCYENVRLEKNG